MADGLTAAAVGLMAGLVVTALLLRRAAVARAEGRFDAWRATELARLRTGAAGRSRAALKARLAEEVLAAAPFSAADARFLGDPVTLVVFEGMAEGEPERVVFVGGDEAGVVAECVAAGRVEWATLVLQRSTP